MKFLIQYSIPFYKLKVTSKKFLSTIRYLSSAANNGQKRPFRSLDAAIIKDDIFEENKARSLALINKFQSAESLAKGGGGEKAIMRHTLKQKKLLVTERIKLLIDEDSDFLELSLTAGLGMEYGDVPRAGIITGIGKVNGRLCVVVANDATVKGGTIYPVTLKKHLRAQEIAEENRLPTIYVVESGGAFLPLQSEIFLAGGRTFYNEAVLSSQGIPQIAIVCGNCTAGGAYIPTMADEAVMIHKQGFIFLGGPPLVQAATGEVVSAEELGGATLHCSVSGCADYHAKDEPEAFLVGRDIAATLPSHNYYTSPGEEPLYDAEELLGLVSPNNEIDIYKVIARITDGSRFHEFKTTFGPSLVTGFSYIKGCLVGIIGSNGAVTEFAADKGAHFVQMCCERDIPLIFLMNTVDRSNATNLNNGVENGNMMRAHAKMLSAVSCCNVPRLTFVIGNCVGFDSYIMSGRSTSPNFLFCWPNAVIGITAPDTVIQNVCQARLESTSSEEERVTLEKQVTDKCKMESTAFFAASRVWNDGIILPQDTRKVIGQCLDIVMAYRLKSETKSAVVRM